MDHLEDYKLNLRSNDFYNIEMLADTRLDELPEYEDFKYIQQEAAELDFNQLDYDDDYERYADYSEEQEEKFDYFEED